MSSTVLTGNPAGPYVGTASCVDAGFGVTSVSIKVPVQAMLDDAAWMNADKLSKSAGGTVVGATSFSDITAATISGPVARYVAAATLAERVIAHDPTSNAEIFGADADLHFVDSLTTAGNSDYTIKSTSPAPPPGARVRLSVLNSGLGKNLRVLRESAVVVISFIGGGADHFWADFEFMEPYGGGTHSWRLVGFGGTTAPTVGTP